MILFGKEVDIEPNFVYEAKREADKIWHAVREQTDVADPIYRCLSAVEGSYSGFADLLEEYFPDHGDKDEAVNFLRFVNELEDSDGKIFYATRDCDAAEEVFLWEIEGGVRVDPGDEISGCIDWEALWNSWYKHSYGSCELGGLTAYYEMN